MILIIVLDKKLIHADYSAMIEEIETNSKTPKFKVGDRVSVIKYKNILSKGCTKELIVLLDKSGTRQSYKR